MNKLYHGDNLKVMRSMPDESVDLIATDPPFNTGKDWVAFDDRWEGGLDGYLKFMKPRLEECHRLLNSKGSLYLHCDPTASHYLKVMLDGIFGIKQFRTEIIWKRHWGSGNDAKSKFGTHHDIILIYSKTSNACFNPIYIPYTQEYIDQFFKSKDSDGRRYTQPFSNNDSRRNGNNAKRRYLDESEGVKIGSIWIDKSVQLSPMTKERVDYPTQKPVALYQRMIKASSNQHDIILDPFCGSGTTLDAAECLQRHWIGIDQSEQAIETTRNRLEKNHGLLLKYELIERG